MSTKDQKHSEDSSADSAPAGGLPGNLRLNEEQSQASTTNPANEKPSCSKRLKEFYQKPKAWLETIGLVVLIFYTIFAGIQSYTMTRTLTEIKQQTDIAEAQNRPWLKIEDVATDTSASEVPVISFSMLPTTPKPLNGVSLRAEFHIRNIGKGVAQNVSIMPIIALDSPRSPVSLVGDWERRTCMFPAYPPIGPPFYRSAIFPGDAIISYWGTAQPFDVDKINHIDSRPGDFLSGTLVACVTYQYPRRYQTIAVFSIMGPKDRFIEVNKSLTSGEVRLLRNTAYEYAQ